MLSPTEAVSHSYTTVAFVNSLTNQKLITTNYFFPRSSILLAEKQRFGNKPLMPEIKCRCWCTFGDESHLIIMLAAQQLHSTPPAAKRLWHQVYLRCRYSHQFEKISTWLPKFNKGQRPHYCHLKYLGISSKFKAQNLLVFWMELKHSK